MRHERIPTALAVLASLFMGVSFAQDAAKVEQSKPTLGEFPAPPKPKPTPQPLPRSPDDPRPLDINKVRLFWVEDYESTVPVRWTVTPMDSFALADVFPVGTKPVFIMQGDVRAKEHKLPDNAKSAIQIWGVSKGRILLQADGVKDNQIVTLVKVMIDVDGPQAPIPPPVDPPKPPVDPPTKPVRHYFLIVRPDGPAKPDFVAVMGNAAWDKHRAAGRTVKEMTLTESLPIYKAPAGTVIPFVVTLGVSDTETKVIAGPVALPSDSAGIDKLAEGLPK